MNTASPPLIHHPDGQWDGCGRMQRLVWNELDSGLWPSTSSSFEVNWNAHYQPDLITHYQCCTSIMFLTGCKSLKQGSNLALFNYHIWLQCLSVHIYLDMQRFKFLQDGFHYTDMNWTHIHVCDSVFTNLSCRHDSTADSMLLSIAEWVCWRVCV